MKKYNNYYGTKSQADAWASQVKSRWGYNATVKHTPGGVDEYVVQWSGTVSDAELNKATIEFIDSIKKSSGSGGGSSGASGSSSGNQFLWKPESEADNKLAVLIPDGPSQISIKDARGNVIETAKKSGTYEDGRAIYRFSKPGDQYPGNVSVNGVTIQNTANRYQSDPSKNFSIGSPSSLLRDLGPDDVLGKIPEVAEFATISPEQAIRASLESAQNTFGESSEFVSKVNEGITTDALDRIEQIAPQSRDNFNVASDQIGRLLRGELPRGVVDNVAGDRAELSSILGMQGGDLGPVLKDLGLTQLDALDKGLSMFERIINAAEVVDPAARQQTVKDFKIDPTTALAGGLEQNKILQETQQNKNNAASFADPASRALYSALTQEQAVAGVPSSLDYDPFKQGPFENKILDNLIQTGGK